MALNNNKAGSTNCLHDRLALFLHFKEMQFSCHESAAPTGT